MHGHRDPRLESEYAVRVLRRYGIDKLAASPSLLSKGVDAAKWLFTQHPNTHSYIGLGPAGHEIERGTNWLGRQVWKHKPMAQQALQPIAGRGPGLLNALKDTAHTWGDVARDMYLGSPVSGWQDFQKHRAAAGGSYLKGYGRFLKHDYWHPEHPVMNAIGLGMTGMDIYHAATGDPSQRRGDFAAAATGAAITPITGRMGALIGAPIHLALTGAARNLGHRFDPPPAGGPVEQTPYAPRLDPRGHTRRWLRTSPNLPDVSGIADLPDVLDSIPTS